MPDFPPELKGVSTVKAVTIALCASLVVSTALFLGLNDKLKRLEKSVGFNKALVELNTSQLVDAGLLSQEYFACCEEETSKHRKSIEALFELHKVEQEQIDVLFDVLGKVAERVEGTQKVPSSSRFR